MTGPFGGEIAATEQGALEALSPELSVALAAAFGASQRHPTNSPDSPADAARVVWFEPDAAGVRYDAPLANAPTLRAAALPTAVALTTLARVARRLEHLHAQGAVHGDLRPDMVLITPAESASSSAAPPPTLLAPARTSAPGAVLRTRLRHGADPTDVGYCAPEVAAGYELTPASDAYGLAAITHATLSGYSPLGQLSVRRGSDPLGQLANCVLAALSQDPSQRPSVTVIAGALERAAEQSAKPVVPAASPYRAAPGAATVSSAAEAQAVRARAEEMSPVLLLVLVVGGLIAFVGAVLLVVAGWDVVGEFGRVVMLGALSAGSWGAGEIAARKSLPAGATALRGVGVLFALVAVGYSFYLLGDNQRLLFLAALAAGAFAGGLAAEKRNAPMAGAALVALSTQLLWAVGGYWLYLVHSPEPLGGFTFVAGSVSAVTYGLTLARRSSLLGGLSALDFAIFASALGAYLSTGAVTGPAVYLGLVALGYTALTAGAAARDVDGAGMALATGALFAGWASACLGISVLGGHPEGYTAFGTLWPFAIALAAALAERARDPYGNFGFVCAAGVVCVAPTIEAVVRPEIGFTLLAVAIGAAVLGAALFHPRFARDEGRQMGTVMAGLFGVVASPAMGYARNDASPEGVHVAVITLVSLGLLALSFVASARGGRRSAWRAIEIVALVQFFGLFTLRSLEHQDDLSNPVVVILTALAVLVIGRGTRRLMPAVVGGAALGLNLWIQYFVRLSHILPLSVLLVGFGAGLLVMGVVYEQGVKRHLDALREWS